MRRTAVVPFLLSLLAAQEPSVDPFGHSRHGGEFDEGPRTAAYRMQGISEQVHFPIAGLSVEAQAFFDQGVCQQHGFWYFEAERSFRQVALLQPECAMAYWGMAMANVETWQRAAGFTAQAVQRSKDVPANERLWIDALATLYQIDDVLRADLQSSDAEKVKQAKVAVVAKKERDEKKLHREFLRGLETVVAACPDDIEAKAFTAIQSWRNVDHGIDISSHAAVDALLAQVFAKAPKHPAHHYRIHLWDREKGERALQSAASNGDSAPGIAHQWHMAGHIYAKLHRHPEAAWQQEASGRVDHAHMQRDRVMPFLIHNYGHNQEWLARSLSYGGRAAEALAVAKNLAELPRHPKWNKIEDGDDIAGYARARLVQVCEDLELWEDAVRLCHDGYLERSESVKSEVQRLGLLGRALFRLQRLDEAARVVADVDALLVKARAVRAAAMDKAESEAFAKKEDSTKTREAAAEAGREPSSSVRSVLDLQRELRAEELLAKGDAKAALVEFEAVGDLPKGLLADAHVAAGQPEKAIELLEKEVKERPHRLATSARLLIAYRAAGKPEFEARITELATLLREPWVAVDRGGLAKRCELLPRPGTGLTLNVDDEPLFPENMAMSFGADFGPRPLLASLGPIGWQPVANPGFHLPKVGFAEVGPSCQLALNPTGALFEQIGTSHTAQPQRARLVVFYLGFGCLHCVEQLKALRPLATAYAAAGIDVVAIGSESTEKAAAAVAALAVDERFPFPLLADGELAAFKAWRCYDDFEQMPLHGTFLIDADGKVRWQDLSFEPFVQFEWLLTESKRLLVLPAQAGSK